jgi:hypothetical protein
LSLSTAYSWDNSFSFGYNEPYYLGRKIFLHSSWVINKQNILNFSMKHITKIIVIPSNNSFFGVSEISSLSSFVFLVLQCRHIFTNVNIMELFSCGNNRSIVWEKITLNWLPEVKFGFLVEKKAVCGGLHNYKHSIVNIIE